jgi:transcriptional regulator with XRE-family HTH domain
MNIGATVKKIRTKHLKLTQAQLAYKVGVAPSVISRWEKCPGYTSISIQKLADLSAVCESEQLKELLKNAIIEEVGL